MAVLKYIKKALTLLLMAAVFFSVSLPLSASELIMESSNEYYQQYKGQNKSVVVYNWGEYISDGSEESVNVNKEFEALTGIKVQYVNFATNEELYSKLRSGNSSYDIIIPSDYMISKMISEDMLLPLVFEKIPNAGNISEEFQAVDYDPTGEYSLPYTWGTTGIIYNKELIDPDDDVETWEILWDEKYLGEILMFYNARDTFSIAQKMLGYSITDVKAEDLKYSLVKLKEQKPLVQAYVMDEIFDKMLSGSAAFAPYYAGDAVTMMEENENLAFAYPREGVNIFVDAICIPKTAPNPDIAHIYINFLLEGEIAAANAEYIGYATPNASAKELLDPEITSNEIAYPPKEVLEKAEYFTDIPTETAKLMDEYWAELLSSDDQYNEAIMPIFLVVGLLAVIFINARRSKKKRPS